MQYILDSSHGPERGSLQVNELIANAVEENMIFKDHWKLSAMTASVSGDRAWFYISVLLDVSWVWFVSFSDI